MLVYSASSMGCFSSSLIIFLCVGIGEGKFAKGALRMDGCLKCCHNPGNGEELKGPSSENHGIFSSKIV